MEAVLPNVTTGCSRWLLTTVQTVNDTSTVDVAHNCDVGPYVCSTKLFLGIVLQWIVALLVITTVSEELVASCYRNAVCCYCTRNYEYLLYRVYSVVCI